MTGEILTMQVTISRALGLLAVPCLLYGLTMPASHAVGFTPYKISMSRTKPDKPIRKSEIMSFVRETYPGQILSIREDTKGGSDCHIVKSMGDDGELRIIEVACKR